jgi:hypothetical protein
MTISYILDRLFHGPHVGYVVVLIVGLYNAVSSWFVDAFLDESESSASDDAERVGLGWKATKFTRPIMSMIFMLAAAFALWKMWQQ